MPLHTKLPNDLPDDKQSRRKTLLIMKVAAGIGIGLILVLLVSLQHAQNKPPVTLRTFQAPQPSYRKTAPALQWQDSEGHLRSLKDLLGHVVIVEMWAHWCYPCLVELPTLNQLSQRLGDPDLEVVGLNVDTDEGHLKSAVEYWQDENLSFDNFFLSKDGKNGLDHLPQHLPMQYVIDREGQVVFEAEGALDWSDPAAEQFIKKLLQASPSSSDVAPPESE